jgi:glycosidase
MGDAQDAFAVLTFTARGVPLLYNGQEACLNKSLRFFSRDTIVWDTCARTEFYRDLIRLKKENIALWNGEYGGRMDTLTTGKDNKLFAFLREKDENRLIVILNLSKKPVTIKPEFDNLPGEYKEYFTGRSVVIPFTDELMLKPWDYIVLIRQ